MDRPRVNYLIIYPTEQNLLHAGLKAQLKAVAKRARHTVKLHLFALNFFLGKRSREAVIHNTIFPLNYAPDILCAVLYS